MPEKVSNLQNKYLVLLKASLVRLMLHNTRSVALDPKPEVTPW